MTPPAPDQNTWDQHWRELDGDRSWFGRLASLVRRKVIAGAVRRYASRRFANDGWFVETGCGTGESSRQIETRGRRLAGLDFSLPALLAARRHGTYRALIRADIHALPFRSETLAGVWNLGVMEHFPPDEGTAILREHLRVLAPGGSALLFWPPEFGSSRLLLGPIEGLRSVLTGRRFRFFPDEVNRLRSPRHAREALREAGFAQIETSFTPLDAFIHMVIVGRK